MKTAASDKSTPTTRGRTLHRAALYDVVTKILALGREGRMREMTVELAQVQPGDSVLDVGCGTGTLTIVAKKWAGLQGEVHGIDAAPEMIEAARRKAAQDGVEVDFQVGLIEDIPFPDDRFDVLLSSLMLHHLPGDLKRKGFVEMSRVLKPGGRLLVVDFEPPTHHAFKALAKLFMGREMAHNDVPGLAAMARDAGFVEVETGRTRYKILSFVRGCKPDGSIGKSVERDEGRVD